MLRKICALTRRRLVRRRVDGKILSVGHNKNSQTTNKGKTANAADYPVDVQGEYVLMILPLNRNNERGVELT